MDELQALIKVSFGEWKGVILFGIYTGQRLRRFIDKWATPSSSKSCPMQVKYS